MEGSEVSHRINFMTIFRPSYYTHRNRNRNSTGISNSNSIYYSSHSPEHFINKKVVSADDDKNDKVKRDKIN